MQISVETIVGGLAVLGAVIAWAFRMERLTARLLLSNEHLVALLTDEKNEHSVVGRLNRHSDQFDKITNRLKAQEALVGMENRSPEELVEIGKLFMAAADVLKRKREMGE